MTITITEFNIYKIKRELLNKFRYGFNSLDPKERITEITTTYDGDSSKTFFVLSPTNMCYVKSVSVGGTALEFGSEWDIHWRGNEIGKVEIYTPPVTGTDNVSIVWGNTNTSNFVHSDWPRSDLGTHSYPRVGFKVTVRSKVAGLGGGEAVIGHDILVQIKVVDEDVFNIDYITSEIHAWIVSNAKNWYYFNWIEPQSLSEYNPYDDNSAQTNSRVVEFIIPRKLETRSYV